jgi:hypothetical protein
MFAIPALIIIVVAVAFEFLMGVSILDAISDFLERNVR